MIKYTKNSFCFIYRILSLFYLFSFMLWQPVVGDCFCGTKDEVPSTYGYQRSNQNKGNRSFINSSLTANYNLASIVNYIDIFISKFNRLKVTKPQWDYSLMITGVKSLNFKKESKASVKIFKTILKHQLSKNLFIEVIVELVETSGGKNQYNISTNLIRNNTGEIEVKTGTKAKWNAQFGGKMMVYQLKRSSLSHFYGNQMAVDVCRVMYVTINKILVEFFYLDLKSVLYRKDKLNSKLQLQDKDCIVQPSFKVYLGVTQINQMITSSREQMDKYKVNSTGELLRKLKTINKEKGNMKAVLPELKRRNSLLLTPITIEENGRELLADDYDNAMEYQEKVREILNEDFNEFLDDEDENNLAQKSQGSPNSQMIEEKLLQKLNENQNRKVLQPESKIMEIKQQKILIDEKSYDSNEDGIGLMQIMSEDIQRKEDNLELLDLLIGEVVDNEYKQIPLKKESRSEGYIQQMKEDVDLRQYQKRMLMENLGIDIDEDLSSQDPQKIQELRNFIQEKFVLLRMAPLDKERNVLFEEFGQMINPQRNQRLCDNSDFIPKNIPSLQKSKSISRLNIDQSPLMINLGIQEVQVMKEQMESHSSSSYENISENIRVIGENRIINTLRLNESPMPIMNDGLSQVAEIDIQNVILTSPDVSESSQKDVEVVYKKNDYLEQQNLDPELILFQKNNKLSESERQEMIRKIIDIKTYILLHDIKCDFEIYSDNTYYIGLPDIELINLFPKLRKLSESAIQERIPVLIETKNYMVNDETGQKISEEQYQQMVEENNQANSQVELEIVLDGYTKQQVEQIMLLLSQDQAFLGFGHNEINPDKQDQLDQMHLLEYDITEYIRTDLKTVPINK